MSINNIKQISNSSVSYHGTNAYIFASVFWLSLLTAFIYTTPAFAYTNVAGVKIEVIDDEAGTITSSNVVEAEFNKPNSEYEDIVVPNQENPESGDIWDRIKAGYAIPNIQSDLTAKHESWYASRPEYVKRMIERSQKYLFHIVEEVEKRNMPTEIALLPMIESAYNPLAYSRSRASGIWQFIPATGKLYGLKQNWWVDNRRNVTAATEAALNYLQKLHGQFGTWDLALAAYNAGEGTVQRAIDRNRKAGLPTNYQSLRLPPETRNYVPKLQAIKNIITEPQQFNLRIASIANQPYFTQVTAPKQIDAKLAAELAEISIEEFNALNPGYNRPLISGHNESHQLLLPIEAAERFNENLANYDKPLTSWQTYHAKRGEHMENIAKKFGIKLSQLRYVNSLSNNKKIRNAQPVLVPAVYSKQDDIDISGFKVGSSAIGSNGTFSKTAPIHKVKRGDTLHAIALRYDTSTKYLMKINRLRSSKLRIGQSLKVGVQKRQIW